MGDIACEFCNNNGKYPPQNLCYDSDYLPYIQNVYLDGDDSDYSDYSTEQVECDVCSGKSTENGFSKHSDSGSKSTSNTSKRYQPFTPRRKQHTLDSNASVTSSRCTITSKATSQATCATSSRGSISPQHSPSMQMKSRSITDRRYKFCGKTLCQSKVPKFRNMVIPLENASNNVEVIARFLPKKIDEPRVQTPRACTMRIAIQIPQVDQGHFNKKETDKPRVATPR
uniref:Uncharacterized protein n=1 Tax=Babesia bovis TaxID=5865 RepID=S6B1R5_BABBO|nr:hypothetical protein [Babesia bovis]